MQDKTQSHWTKALAMTAEELGLPIKDIKNEIDTYTKVLYEEIKLLRFPEYDWFFIGRLKYCKRAFNRVANSEFTTDKINNYSNVIKEEEERRKNKWNKSRK